MGLDQYLSARIELPDYALLREEYRNAESEQLSSLRSQILQALGPHNPEPNDATGLFAGPTQVMHLEMRCAYWRKANAIHAWFDRLEDKELDNCEERSVSLEQLQELLETCERLLRDRDDPDSKSLPEAELPTQGGFFFGSEEYGDWYYEQLENTVQQLKPAIAMAKAFAPLVSFKYYGWW